MNFDDWVILIESALNQARGLEDKLKKLDGRNPTPGELASIEGLCRRFLETLPPAIVHTRPRDVMPYEWAADPYAILLSRMHTLQAAAMERTANTTLWLQELRVGLEDFIDGCGWFESRIER